MEYKYEENCKAIGDKLVNSNFSKKEVDGRIFEFLVVISQKNQGARKVKEYPNDLVTICRELDLYRPPTPNSLVQEYIL